MLPERFIDLFNADRQAAMSELYAHLQGAPRSTMLRTLGRQSTEDALHEAFLDIYKVCARGLRDDERIPGAAKTIVMRKIAREIDDQVSYRARHIQVGDTDMVSYRLNPEQLAIRNQERAIARAVIRALDSKDREILERFYFRGQSWPDICAEMSLSPTQFRLLKNRAKERCAHAAHSTLTGHRRQRIAA
jgi:RNA polymerase sigma factor (sigma-70 family)